MSVFRSWQWNRLLGKVRVVDLTQTLSPEFPGISLPPEMGQAWPFRIEEVSRYDERGPAWYWNNFSCGEHTGTHFDAPVHWVSGKDLPNNATDSIPPERFIGPAFVIDCSKEAARDADFLLTRKFIENWETKHGRISPRSWVLMRTDWSKRHDPAEYQNYDEEGQHTPGPDVEAVKFLVDERDVLGFGTESIGTDAGQAYHLRPPYPCHYYMHGAGRYGLQCLTNLDQLPPTGAVRDRRAAQDPQRQRQPATGPRIDGKQMNKIWFQGATDKVHMAPYIAKVEAHLKSILEPGIRGDLPHHHPAGDDHARDHRVPHRAQPDPQRGRGREAGLRGDEQ